MNPLRVLLVDDDPPLRAMMVRILSREGHDMAVTGSAEEALERLAAESFDVVVSASGTGSRLDGWELARQVRGGWPGVRFILATGWEPTLESDAVSGDVDDVVVKPFSIHDLRAIVRGRRPAASRPV
jgi:DNA-binding response OmpR family regulator